MKTWLFVDTSAWYAYVNRTDPAHTSVRNYLHNFHGKLVTSSYIFDELVTLVRLRMGHDSALRVGKLLRDPKSLLLEHVTPADDNEAWTLFSARADKAYSFTDCTSFVVMRRLRISQALTLDAHFASEQFITVP
ncbi:MAG: 23S rRNA-specific endonuclease VapC20 [Syntrophomonadaceae bacterium]|nr:23S rRNA-specific endonuclease VapC20 [Bacillota bacterium]